MSTLHRNASTHALTLGSGRTLAPGEDAELPVDEGQRLHRIDQAFVDAGDLIEVDAEPETKPAKKAAKKAAAKSNDTDQEATS